ncbi:MULTISPECIES: GGDEF domain-containing phosphodiesterase [Luteimonas]|uniref:GGDEF domain-containing phosphodiesterase n=1 Tax=Luteimonas TaxID=83614 RepID=UPI000C7C64D2|nr:MULTISPECIES: GGDEF domain-containing phosphodiesterase [Luteimonas]
MLNRTEVLARAAAIAADAREDAPTAFLVVRTPRARDVELALGYDAGAALGEAMEAAIRASVRAGDTVLRIGEYDFLVLLPGLHGRAHAALGAAKIVRTLQQPVAIDGRSVQPAVVVGIAVCPHDGEDAALLCRRADQASLDALATPERHAFWVAPALPLDILHDELRIAIADNQLQMFLQPIATLPDRAIGSYEALSRWTHPVLGVVPPDVFIGVAERGGLIGELTRWNLNVALRTLAALRQDGRAVRIAVNLSVEALQLPGFVDQVLDLLRLWRVPGDALELEITESALMRDVTRCSHLLGALRDEGVRIAIDDFGTGYSSLAYLRRLPVDSLKIDRSFIRDIGDDIRARRMVGTSPRASRTRRRWRCCRRRIAISPRAI